MCLPSRLTTCHPGSSNKDRDRFPAVPAASVRRFVEQRLESGRSAKRGAGRIVEDLPELGAIEHCLEGLVDTLVLQDLFRGELGIRADERQRRYLVGDEPVLGFGVGNTGEAFRKL